jgi:hypothetical protein
MSESESMCSPNTLWVFVMRAIRPSRLSSTIAANTP